MKTATVIFLLFATAVALWADSAPERVTVQQLLGAPAAYQGHRVIVHGFWDYGFETSDLFDGRDEEKTFWVEAEKQDVEKPKDKKLMLLQQLFYMRRESEVTPAVSIGLVEVEFEGEFFDWRSMPDVKKQIEKLKDGESLIGGFGHLGGSQQMLKVEKLLWFRCVLEARAPKNGEGGANRPTEPTSGSVKRVAGAPVAPLPGAAHP